MKKEKIIKPKIEKAKQNKETQAVKLLLKSIKKNAISKKHRHDELHWDCPECKFRILEGGLGWYLDLLEWETKSKL